VKLFNNDKDLAIISLTVLGVFALFLMASPENVILTIIGALGGFTAGQIYGKE
jgi:hypothetical protein